MIELNDKFEPLFEAKTRYFLITGGRNSSKSFTVNTFINLLTFERGHKILFTRYTMTSAHISIIPEFNQKIQLLNAVKYFDVQKTEIRNKLTNSEILFRGIKTSSGNQTANLKSLEGITTWVVDEAEEMPSEDEFNKISLSVRSVNAQNRIILILNPCHIGHWIYKRFFEKYGIKEGYNGIKGNVTYIHTDYRDNINNIPKDYLDEINEIKETNNKRYQHEILGGWVKDVEGALWKYDTIQKNRVLDYPDLKRIIIAVDPAVTANEKSDETGIIVVGVGSDRYCYILEDMSGKYDPDKWAKKVCYLYHKWECNYIVAEANQGGDLVKRNIAIEDSRVVVKLVRAYRGKYLRAEPVAALYLKNEIKHVGMFNKLENQMTMWSPSETNYSPDRIDALVYGITELKFKKKETYFG